MKGRSKIDLVGVRFGRLLVSADAGRMPNGAVTWACRCDCGRELTVEGSALRAGRTVSCGCYRSEFAKKIIHGEARDGSRTREHRIWAGMIDRCTNPRHVSYCGRGIDVCERWRQSYSAFLEDMGRCPPRHSIDRIDNTRGYEPGNCRWATATVQSFNRRPRGTLGVRGVYKAGSKYVATIARGGVRVRLGRFATVEAATAARATAELTLYPDVVSL